MGSTGMTSERTCNLWLVGTIAFLLVSVVAGTGCEPGSLPAIISSPSNVPATNDPEIDRLTAEAGPVETQLAESKFITASPPPTGRPPTNTPAPFPTGILDVSDPPFPHDSYVISTKWLNIVNGERTIVFSGARRDSSGATPVIGRGLIVVQVYSSDLSQKDSVEYEAAGATGVLTIVAATDYRLTLTGAHGTTLFFDVPSRQFIESPIVTVTAPTVTSLPLAAPTSTPLPTGYPNQTPSPDVTVTMTMPQTAAP